MEIYQKFILFIIIVTLTYIFFRLLNKRKFLIKSISEQPDLSLKEGFYASADETEYNNLIKNKFYEKSAQIQSMIPENQKLSLKHVCIKASYNTAYTGSFVNTKMVEYVISRGCRFIDFEVFSIDNVPYVGVSNDPTYTNLTSQNKIILDNAFSAVVTNAFSSTCSNPGDPIFIQLRIKSQNNDVYKSVAKSVNHILSSKLYSGKINGDTKMSDIMGKVILVMDSSINPNYKNFVTCSQGGSECYNLSDYVNIETGGNTWLTYTNNMALGMMNTPPSKDDSNVRKSDVKLLKLVIPDNTPTNPNMFDLLKKHGIQTAEYMFYLPDEELYRYEAMFNYYNTTFVPMGYAIDYVKKMDDGV